MAWQRIHSDLREILAGLYGSQDDSRRIVVDAGIPITHVAFKEKPITNWQSILETAIQRDKVDAIVEQARKEFPDNEWLRLAAERDLRPARVPDASRDFAWEGRQEDTDALEKIIGKQSTLLPISFLERGLQVARSVCRIVVPDIGTGSGFLLDKGLVVTNNHVLPRKEICQKTFVEFNYQKTLFGADADVDTYELDADRGFWTDEGDDWTIVRVKGDPQQNWGALKVGEETIDSGERVCIVQHPGGGYKQLAIHHNFVVFANEKRVQYLTDTMPGSSGSPVFDQNWNLVAIHHSGGWLREPESSGTYFRNEGIPIAIIRRGLVSAGLT